MRLSSSHLTGLVILFLSSAAAAQTIYRCAGPNGTLTFSDKPCGPDAVRVEHLPPLTNSLPPAAGNESQSAATTTRPPHVQVNVDNDNTVNVQPPHARPDSRPSRGLPFSVYRRLETGMSEGQVLAIAGPPDHETVDSENTADGVIRKSYYYVSSGYNAFITRIQFVNGEVRSIERTPRLSQ